MKLTAKTLLLILSLYPAATLVAQAQVKPKSSAFPSQIQHVVVIFQENRTPDNLFHFLPSQCTIPSGASGLAACMPSPVTTSCYDISPCGLSNESGSPLPVTLTAVPLSGSTDPSHAHTAWNQMCDPDPTNGYACKNDGAWQIKQSAGVSNPTSYAYVSSPKVTNYDGSKGHLLDPYITYATQYGWANFMYQTNQGPSYPAHQFIFSGTSAISAANDAASTFISENYKNNKNGVGCLAGAKTTTTQISPLLGTLGANCTAYDNNSVEECLFTNTALTKSNPVGSFCDTKPNMGEVLDGQNVTWKYYAPSAGSIWTAPNSIQDICVPQFSNPPKNTLLECTGTEWNANVDLNLKGADVLNDITNCNLASVSWIIPDGTWSDHAGLGDKYGPSWVTAIINEIGQNPPCTSGIDNGQTFWNNTAIIVTWDDWGGWSDNQPTIIESALPCTSSNCQGDYQLGFRVPLVVVSAYTPADYIDNGNYDFGSILRTIEGIYGIPEGTMGLADARSTTDLSNFFTGSARTYTFVPAVEPPSYFLGEEAQKGAPVPPDDDGDDD